MIPVTWVMRTPIPDVLLNDRDPCCSSKHVIHDQAAVEVISPALVWIARCLQPPMRLYLGRPQQLPSLQGLTGGEDIPLFLLSLIPPLPHSLLPFFSSFHPRRKAGVPKRSSFASSLNTLIYFFLELNSIHAPEIVYWLCLVVYYWDVCCYFPKNQIQCTVKATIYLWIWSNVTQGKISWL